MLTPIPYQWRLARMRAEYGLTAALFPLIGLLIGALAVNIARAASLLWPSPVVRCLLWLSISAISWYQVDCLADFSDAFLQRRDRAETLRIIKEPQLGTLGTMAIVLALGVQLVCLIQIPEPQLVANLLAVPMVSRWSMMVVMFRAAPMSRTSSMRPLLEELKPWMFFGMSGIVVSIAVFILGPVRGVIDLAIAALMGICIRQASLSRLGGVQGDVIGAASEITVVLSLPTATARI